MTRIKILFFLFSFLCLFKANAQRPPLHKFRTKYMDLTIDEQGYIVNIIGKATKKDYAVKKHPSPLLTLDKHGKNLLPTTASYAAAKGLLTLNYPGAYTAILKVDQKGDYLKFKLQSLNPSSDIDNIIWGPYQTNIHKTIGEIISVARDDEYAVGIMALDDNTTSGPPVAGDMGQGSYIIHTPDPVKFPIPASLKPGQRFRIGGDGINDVAFYSHPEEYYRFMNGNGAEYIPEYGISLTLHARNRRKKQTILLPHFNDFPPIKAPRHMDVDPIPVDFNNSGIAFYACPDKKGLDVIEQIVLNEGLAYVTRNGKWVRRPENFKVDIAWFGKHDSLVSYANQLNLKAVQDEGLGEYYVNPADPWAGKKVTLSGRKQPITALTALTNPHGIAYGLHTLTEFIQPHSSDVHPYANDSLCTVLKTTLTVDIGAHDSLIIVKDTSYLNEHGGWDDNGTNVLKIGKELLKYKGVTQHPPYKLIGVERGAYKTVAAAHQQGDTIAKLQVNCYSGFIPDMRLQDQYAYFYAKLLHDGGMNYIDFDGFESFVYTGHGQYAFKRFMRKLFDDFRSLGGDYLQVMGSCVFEGNWHYMTTCNIGGGDHMFNPRTNKWGIEGKDIRYSWTSNYFPPTFGIQYLKPDWTVQMVENLQAKAIAWDATYMFGISEDVVEKNLHKKEIFTAFRAWENAREANVFSQKLKLEMQNEENQYHLEQTGAKIWELYLVDSSGKFHLKSHLKK